MSCPARSHVLAVLGTQMASTGVAPVGHGSVEITIVSRWLTDESETEAKRCSERVVSSVLPQRDALHW